MSDSVAHGAMRMKPIQPETVRGTSMPFSRTMIGSPTLTVFMYHSASSVLSPMQPWLTFSYPI
ncbi:hypothetical protein MycrhN_5501 [Mycolicibacterium rhodesiae NBB3]|uniref:Uncharacterized protein n=1 Tax=Mycolicibacterium rhodesiae (strain NBB3) TaxID=710685 RepID=G8RJN3_MYCRN|nr:hypothetical protein MycrhN_5501 [Mycolicibacterium rhodesiae NBB3]